MDAVKNKFLGLAENDEKLFISDKNDPQIKMRSKISDVLAKLVNIDTDTKFDQDNILIITGDSNHKLSTAGLQEKMKKFIVQAGATWLTNDDGTPDEASITEFFTSELLKQNRKNAVTFCVYNREKTDGSLIDLNTPPILILIELKGFLRWTSI